MAEFILNNNLFFLTLGILSFFLSAYSLVILSILWKENKTLKQTVKTLTLGKDSNSLEDTILDLVDDVKSLDSDIQELFNISNKIYALANRGLHKVDMIRFNPFKDHSGNQSFSIALLDGKNNGIIISSLHTREGTRVYSKEIKKGISPKHKLTEEETIVLKNAMNKKIIISQQTNQINNN